MRIVAYVPDLMDRSRIDAISASAPASVEFVMSPTALIESTREGAIDLALVDLGRPGVLEALPNVTVRTIGFGSHVDHELLAAARAAGCSQVLARSAFFARLGSLLGGPVGSDSDGG